MSETKSITLTYALFDDEESASAAVDTLLKDSFLMHEVTVLTRREGVTEELPVASSTRAETKGAAGTLLGAAAGVTFALAGPWVGAGMLLLAVQGALVGGATGGAVGVLAGLDWQDYEIDFDDEHFPAEKVLVGVMSRHRTEQAAERLREAGATAVYQRTPGRAFEAFTHPDYVDVVDEAGRESFPASDPPSWTP